MHGDRVGIRSGCFSVEVHKREEYVGRKFVVHFGDAPGGMPKCAVRSGGGGVAEGVERFVFNGLLLLRVVPDDTLDGEKFSDLLAANIGNDAVFVLSMIQADGFSCLGK